MWHSEESARKAGRFVSAGTTSGRASAQIAEDLCTRQLGYRTELDAAAAQRREVHQHRYTSLDRIIKRDAEEAEEADSPFFTVAKDPNRSRTRSQCAAGSNSTLRND